MKKIWLRKKTLLILGAPIILGVAAFMLCRISIPTTEGPLSFKKISSNETSSAPKGLSTTTIDGQPAIIYGLGMHYAGDTVTVANMTPYLHTNNGSKEINVKFETSETDAPSAQFKNNPKAIVIITSKLATGDYKVIATVEHGCACLGPRIEVIVTTLTIR